MLSTKAKIGMLVAGHIVAGLMLTWPAGAERWPGPAEVAQAAILFADAGLLGVWGALGETRLWWRLTLVLLATAWLIMVTLAGGSNAQIVGLSLMIGLPTVLLLLVLIGLRHSHRQLQVVHSLEASTASEGFQFTIRHLLLTTAIVAVVLAIGKNIPHLDEIVVIVVVVLCPCLVLVELAVLWATLGFARPAMRLSIVLPAAFVVGLVPPFYSGSLRQQGWTTFVAWSCITGLQAAIIAGTLLVVRSCGYRLASRKANAAGTGKNCRIIEIQYSSR